jgi:hypothetical protein
MAHYTFIDETTSKFMAANGSRRTFPISKETRERLATTQGLVARHVSAVHISSSAFDHVVGTMRVQA